MSSITMSCPNCGSVYTPDLCQSANFDEKLERWQKGDLIQNVWPDATPIQREQLQTGLCSDEGWDEYLGVGEE